jgi:hypothetical protein
VRKVVRFIDEAIQRRLSDSGGAMQRSQAKLKKLAETGGYAGLPGAVSLKGVLGAYLRSVFAKRASDADDQARSWAEDYVIPADITSRDVSRLEGLTREEGIHPLVQLAAIAREERLADRLNVDRMRTFEKEEPPEGWGKEWDMRRIQQDWERLREFAAEGVPVVRVRTDTTRQGFVTDHHFEEGTS